MSKKWIILTFVLSLLSLSLTTLSISTFFYFQSPFRLDLESTTSTPTITSLPNWIEHQEVVSWKALLRNIHPKNTSKGCIVASPSQESPNYWFQWTRDSALVMRNIVERYKREGGERDLNFILDYVEATGVMQHKKTRSGGFSTGGLGEVKFYVDNEPFDGDWGRPQHDGPASRAITLINFSLHQLEFGTPFEKEFVRTKLYDSQFPSNSIIKGDLEHIAHRWDQAGFDLWEEVSASHFYTLLTIRQALILGAHLATILSDPGAATYYTLLVNQITPVLEEFWSPSKGIIRVSLNHTRISDLEGVKESELDVAILLAVLHSGRGTEWDRSEKLFATLDRLMETMSELYPLNHILVVPAIGRYPEDIYDGVGTSIANPWFICTLAAAEILYHSSNTLAERSSGLEITSISLAFYRRFLPTLEEGIIIKGGGEKMKKLVRSQRELADEFMRVVQKFVARNGSLSEQFDRVTGEQRGARDLTWSYAAFITAAEARRGGDIDRKAV